MGMNKLETQSLDGLLMSSSVWKNHMKTVDVTKLSYFIEDQKAPYYCYRDET